MDTEGKTTFFFHCAVAFFIPLLVQLSLMNYNPNTPAKIDDDYESSDIGFEDKLVFLRHVFISTLLCITYYIRLRILKATFIRGSLHELNEKSISDVLDKVSEPILIVKKKHRLSMKPKYLNQAAKDILQYEKFTQRKQEHFNRSIQ